MSRMQTEPQTDIADYCQRIAEQAHAAGRKLVRIGGDRRNAALHRLAELLDQRRDELAEANEKDLARAGEFGLTEAQVDRLRLHEQRISKMARSAAQIAEQTDPVGQVIDGYVRPNGLKIEKVRVPLGVILFIYESRPDVTCDAAALCLKSGNALILRGGKEAIHSNTAIARLVQQALADCDLDPSTVQLVETTDREAVGELLSKDELIDLVIPRGGEGLIRAVVSGSSIPVIKHYTGNCHVYVDRRADQLPENMAAELCVNAKTQRTGVCNAAETMLFHRDRTDLLRDVARRLSEQGVELRVCPETRRLLEPALEAGRLKEASDEDWTVEYLNKTLAVRTVDSLDEAIDHINTYGSHHTDAIFSADSFACDEFTQRVDSANVMVNCSTRFSDGGEYGLGAEIGISTDKLHARGPMGAADVTTYKWIVRGHGQLRQ